MKGYRETFFFFFFAPIAPKGQSPPYFLFFLLFFLLFKERKGFRGKLFFLYSLVKVRSNTLFRKEKKEEKKEEKVDLNILHIGDKVKKNTKYCAIWHNSITPVI